MTEENTSQGTRQMIFALFVLFILGSSTLEVITEFRAGESVDAMADDMIRVFMSVLVTVVLAREYFLQYRALRSTTEQLSSTRSQLALMDSKQQELAGAYRDIMYKQFDAWGLTASERDIVLLMLKGLSFKEIADLRQTREKTVRQQASTVYRKAGLNSRNELAAWFFEDLLEPLPVS